MSGETDLRRLLREMRPTLNPGCYVFVSVLEVPAGAKPVALVAEPEGTTVVLAREDADRFGLEYSYLSAWITLEVHSALAAVGLTAAVATALAEAGISCNVIAGYYHDHLFVPHERAHEAVAELRLLAG